MATPHRLLDLDSLSDRPVVLIDGKEYQLRTAAIMPPLDTHRFSKLAKRQDVLLNKDDIDDAEERELATLPDKMCRLVLEAPADVLEKLNDKQRMEVVAAFLTAPWLIPATPGRAETTPTVSPSTGESSQPDSPTATGVTH